MKLALLTLLWFPSNSFFISTKSNHRHATNLQGKKDKKDKRSSGMGFSKSSNSKSTIKVRQTYGTRQSPQDALIDIEGAMGEFFRSNEEWHPLFASIAQRDDVPAFDFINGEKCGEEIVYNDNSPWQKLPQVPTGDEKDEDMAVIAKVLDSWQKALTDIPVNEALKEDGNDLHFLEEGRRILCLSRFQVLANGDFENFESSLEKHDVLFQTCWSEIMHLMKEDNPDSGSLIILPDSYDVDDLKQFTDMNVLRPLQWLGINNNIIEVASLQRESPCIRLLHKLSDIPSLEMRDKQLEEENE